MSDERLRFFSVNIIFFTFYFWQKGDEKNLFYGAVCETIVISKMIRVGSCDWVGVSLKPDMVSFFCVGGSELTVLVVLISSSIHSSNDLGLTLT